MSILEAYGHIDEQLAKHLEKAPQPMACAAGCNKCCYHDVDTSVSEAQAVYRAIIALPEGVQAILWRRIETTDRQRKGLNLREPLDRMRAGIPCPLLADGKCQVYESRPIQCRGYFSLSKQKCEMAFFEGTAPETVISAQRYINDIQSNFPDGDELYELGEWLLRIRQFEKDNA